MRMERAWAMPNKETFSIKPIAELLKEEMGEGFWVDPFAGRSRLAALTNDLNPEMGADHAEDAVDFLKGIADNSVDGVLYDPPYSLRQVSECYKGVGKPVCSETTRGSYWTAQKREIARIVKPGGKVISFGWNSNGIGKKLGFEMTRVLLVAHGGPHNDTICVVEVKN